MQGNKNIIILVLSLMLVTATFTVDAKTVVISFEEKEGFPLSAPGSSFDDLSTNKRVVRWTVSNPEGASYTWVTASGPGPDPAAPISGRQIGVLGSGGGIGISFGAMNLKKKANLTLNSFYWAYRGQGDSRPGGKAYLELEYFDLNEKSMGKDRFQGGKNPIPDWSPKFDLAKPSPRFQKVALSKVVFSGVPEIPASQHGTFFLEDITLSTPRKSVTTPTEAKVSKPKQVDTTPPMVRLPSPLPDSTVKGEQLYLVKDGQAVSTIVVPRISTERMKFIIQQDPDNPVPYPKDADGWTTQAALWLREYIRKATGVELRIASEDERPTGTIISVGHTQLAAKAGVDAHDLKYDGGKNIVKENVLYLLGRDNERPMGLVGPHGTCRAALMFLEDHCGVRWFLPTPEGEIIPQVKDISAPRNLAKSFVPAFAYCDGRGTYSPGFHPPVGGTPASLINNFRMGIPALAGGHTYYYAVPSGIGPYKDRGGGKGYFKDHPEYFAMIKGKRTGGPEGNALCSTNPEVKNLLVRWIQERFDEGYEWVSLGQEDGYIPCECPKCEKLDNWRFGAGREAPCERLFLLHKAVIDEVAKSHPDKKVILMCYVPTAWPSKKIDYFGDNCIAQLANQTPEVIKAWRGKTAGMTGYNMYMFNIQMRMGVDIHATPREIAEKIRYLHENGFVGLSNCAETGWGFQGPVFYVLGKTMGDPSLDYRALVEEYCRGVYGQAADTMLEFLNLLYARHEEVLPLPVEDFYGRSFKMPPWITTTELYVMEYPLSFLSQLEQLLQKAEAEADTERARGWVRLTRDHFDFTKLLTHALISYRAYQADSTKENWLELKECVQAFDAYRMKIINYPREYTDRWFPGYDYFCIYLTGNVESQRIHYIPWEKRKPEVLKRGVKGLGIGYRGAPDASWIKEPLTLDFSVRIQP